MYVSVCRAKVLGQSYPIRSVLDESGANMARIPWMKVPFVEKTKGRLVKYHERVKIKNFTDYTELNFLKPVCQRCVKRNYWVRKWGWKLLERIDRPNSELVIRRMNDLDAYFEDQCIYVRRTYCATYLYTL